MSEKSLFWSSNIVSSSRHFSMDWIIVFRSWVKMCCMFWVKAFGDCRSVSICCSAIVLAVNVSLGGQRHWSLANTAAE